MFDDGRFERSLVAEAHSAGLSPRPSSSVGGAILRQRTSRAITRDPMESELKPGWLMHAHVHACSHAHACPHAHAHTQSCILQASSSRDGLAAEGCACTLPTSTTPFSSSRVRSSFIARTAPRRRGRRGRLPSSLASYRRRRRPSERGVKPPRQSAGSTQAQARHPHKVPYVGWVKRSRSSEGPVPNVVVLMSLSHL